MTQLEGKRLLALIPKKNFQDSELEKIKLLVEELGGEIKVASSSLDESTGMMGEVVKPDELIENVKVDDYDAVIFIGGVGASEFWHDPRAHAIAVAAVKKNKLLGAICIAPVILAEAGVLKGIKATVFESEKEQLTAAGAVYTDNPIEIDHKIITCNNPVHAEEFAKQIIKAMLIEKDT